MKVLVTGASGFICGYLIQELLDNGYEVVGLDNFSKYGRLQKSYDSHPRYRLVEGNAKDVRIDEGTTFRLRPFRCGRRDDRRHLLLSRICLRPVGGKRTHYRLLLRRRIWAQKERKLKKIVVLSSSMVFESTSEYPTPEGAERRSPPPRSTYGFQKLAVEYFVQGAYEQYKLPYTIVRPFNCVGIGEKRAFSDRDIMSGNVRLAMSHVVPDLVQKLIKGQDPLHILGDGKQVRHYTYGGDLARGIRVCIEHPAALNQDFNLSTPVRTTVLELAELIWKKIHGSSKPFRYVSDPAYEYDVQERAPAVSKARDLLGFEATTPLSDDP